jgi:lysophospholipase L1-like esterase
MRSVLCYGDSNTYGQPVADLPDDRYGPDVRWPGILRSLLAPDWVVIEEGLSGRTTVSDDPVEGVEKNGRRYLRPCVMSHKPLDLIVLMLGTNDLKVRFNKTASEIAMGVGALVQDIKDIHLVIGQPLPEIMIVSPPPLLDDLRDWEAIFAGGAKEKSHQLAAEYEKLADSIETHFFDAGSVVQCSDVDGFHLSPEAHMTLAHAMKREIDMIGWPEDA